MDEIIKPNSDAALEVRSESTEKPVKVKKRGAFRDFIDAIRPKNPDSFLHHVIHHIIIPSVLNVTEDTLKDGIDHWLHDGDGRYNNRRYSDRDRRGGVSYVPYDNMYENDRNSRPYEPDHRDRRVDPNDIVYRNRQTADMVLEEMRGTIYDTGFCSILDFYEIVRKVSGGGINIPTSFADEKWGWTNLDGIHPSSSYDGKYIIRLPRTVHR